MGINGLTLKEFKTSLTSDHNENIFMTGKSYIGREIEQWCLKHCFEQKDVFRLLYDYWMKNTAHAPGRSTYYFIDGIQKDELGMLWKLRRDTDKSPKLEEREWL